MNKLDIKLFYNSANIDVTFINRLNILSGNSGTGKTFLYRALEHFCLINNIKYKYLDFRSAEDTQEQIINICSDKDVLLLDNADLYLTESILKELRKDSNKILIICMKDTSRISIDSASRCYINYDGYNLVMKEK